MSAKKRHAGLIRRLIAACCGAWLAIGDAGGAAAQQPSDVPPKLPGVIRIGLVKPQVIVGTDDASSAADSVRLILADYLQGPTMEVALLEARLASQYAIEAAQADCDFVLSVALTHERGRMNQAFGRALDKLTIYAPRAGGGDLASVVVTDVIYSAADFAASIRARDQMQLDYRLEAVGSTEPLLVDEVRRRARSDGEDLLSPLVQTVAEAVGAAVIAHSP